MSVQPDHREKAHVLALDSIRGIAAISVVIHHVILMKIFLAAFPSPAWIDCAFFRDGGFLVDLFFVLSGMVMSLSYVQSDFGQFSARGFTVRRLARIYPLHFVMLLAMLLFRLVRIGLVDAGLVAAVPVGVEVNNAYSFFLNVTLLQSVGLVDYLSWNAPSWSISVEFYTYLVFAGLLLLAQQRGSLRWLYAGSAVLVGLSLVVLVRERPDLGAQFDFGIFRCFIGFFIGTMTVWAVSRIRTKPTPFVQGTLQAIVLVAVIAHVALIEPYPGISFAAPVTFAVFLGLLLAFPDAPIVPKALTARPLIWLGKRSYSVYMVHALVVLMAEYFIRGIGPRPVAALEAISPGLATTLNLAAILVVVLLLSDLTYRHVELPGGRLLRQALRDTPQLPSGAATSTAQASN